MCLELAGDYVGRMDFMAPWVGLATLEAVLKPQGWSSHSLPAPPRKTVESCGPTRCPRARPAPRRWPCPPAPARPTAR